MLSLKSFEWLKVLPSGARNGDVTTWHSTVELDITSISRHNWYLVINAYLAKAIYSTGKQLTWPVCGLNTLILWQVDPSGWMKKITTWGVRDCEMMSSAVPDICSGHRCPRCKVHTLCRPLRGQRACSRHCCQPLGRTSYSGLWGRLSTQTRCQCLPNNMLYTPSKWSF